MRKRAHLRFFFARFLQRTDENGTTMKKSVILAAILLVALPAAAQRRHRQELSVSYGWASTSTWIDHYSDLLSDIVPHAAGDVTGWGGVTVSYDLYLLAGLSAGASVVYSSNERKFADTGTKIDNRYWSVLPHAKWRWLNLRVVTFYSRLGAGVTFARAKGAGDKESATQFAFQVSPVGVEVGGRIAAYAEAGIGTSGCLLVGGRYRF